MTASSDHQSRRWRISKAEQAALLPDEKMWSPLDGVPAPEYVPEHWTGPHVGLRLIEAFKTLADLPSMGGGGGTRGFWPEYWPEWADLLAQQQADDAMKEDEARARNRSRSRPSAQAISRMEAAIRWPGQYIRNNDGLARLVQRVAFHRSQERELEYLAHKMRITPHNLRSENRVGLDRIADGLHRDHVSVF